MIKVVGIGAAVADTLAMLDKYPDRNTKTRASSMKQSGGGPCATGIVACSKLGVKSGFIGTLSSDAAGAFLLSDFEKYGVDTSNIEVKSGFRSFTSQIWLDRQTGSRTIVFDKGDLPPLKLNDKQKQAVADAEILMVDGNELEAAIEAASIATQNGTKVLYDAGGMYDGIERLLPFADILIPSEEFCKGVTGKETSIDALISLHEKYTPEVSVVTCGKDGGWTYSGDEPVFYPAYPAEVIDSNGAGDVFHGAFAAAVINGFDYIKCCHFASAVSALKCTGVGARQSVPDFKTVVDYLLQNNYNIYDE